MDSEIKFETVGVIGHTGMVGGATYRYYKHKKYQVVGHSRSKPNLDAYDQDIVFVCVPTPYNWQTGKFEGSIVDEVIASFSPESVVVLKSTVPIGTTDKLQEKYEHIHLLFNPEFLSESTCDADFMRPDRQFVGYTDKSYQYATAVLNFLPNSPYDVIMPAKEAELLKYINNLHGTLQVIEANHYYDVCEKERLNYERVIRAAQASKWVGAPMGRNYFDVWHKGFRGFGGKCFPKDVNAWLEYCAEKGLDSRLLESVKDINVDLLSEQGYSEPESEEL